MTTSKFLSEESYYLNRSNINIIILIVIHVKIIIINDTKIGLITIHVNYVFDYYYEVILIDKIANNTNDITSSSIAADKIRQPIVVFYYE